MLLHAILSTKRFFANGTEPTHVNSSGAECRLRKRQNVALLYRFAGQKILLFSSSTTTTTATTFLLFSLHHHRHHISIIFSPPPPPPHFYCFPPPTPPPTPQHFYCFLSSFYSFPFFFFTRFYKRLPTAIISSFGSNVSCSKQQSWFSSAVS